MTATVNASTSAGVIVTSDTSGALALQTAGTTAVTIDTSQNVGIGTASPTTKTQVSAATGGSATGLSVVASGNMLNIFGSSSTNAGVIINATDGTVGSATGVPTIFRYGGTESMRIDTSGNLGIGTSSPDQKLSVSGRISISGSGYTVSSTNGLVGAYLGDMYLQMPSGKTLQIWKSTTDAVAIFDQSGNLGLGVTPSAWSSAYKAMQLNTYGAIASDTNKKVNISSNVYAYATDTYAYLANDYATLYQQASGQHKWFNAPSGIGAGSATTFTQAMTLDASSNLTLGYGGSGNNNTFFYINGTTASNYGNIIRFQQNGTQVFDVGDYAAIQSGSTHLLMCRNVSGGVYLATTSATSWTAVSDETRKVIIEPITDAANKVSTLRAVIGRLKTDDESVRRPYLIAQDVQAVLPEAVTETEDKEGTVLGLSYTEMIPLLVAAIKELNTLITAQAAEITALKAKVGI